MRNSWAWEELHSARNFKNSFKNIYTGLAYSGLYKILGGMEPFDMRNSKKDSQQTERKGKHKVPTL